MYKQVFALFKILQQSLVRLTHDQIILSLSRREMDSPVVSSSYCQCELCNIPVHYLPAQSNLRGGIRSSIVES
jgi:hypothetical protein